jgi:hypothetical protein
MASEDKEKIKDLRKRRRELKKTVGVQHRAKSKEERFVKRKSRGIADERVRENVKGGYGKGEYRIGKKVEEGTGGKKKVETLHVRAPKKEKYKTPPKPEPKPDEPILSVTVQEGPKTPGGKGKELGYGIGEAKDAGKTATGAGAQNVEEIKKSGERFREEVSGEKIKDKGYKAHGQSGRQVNVGEQKKPRPSWKAQESKRSERRKKLEKKVAGLEAESERGLTRSDVAPSKLEKHKEAETKRGSKSKFTEKYATKAAKKAAAESFRKKYEEGTYKGRGFEIKEKRKKLVAKAKGPSRKKKKGGFYKQYK